MQYLLRIGEGVRVRPVGKYEEGGIHGNENVIHVRCASRTDVRSNRKYQHDLSLIKHGLIIYHDDRGHCNGGGLTRQDIKKVVTAQTVPLKPGMILVVRISLPHGKHKEPSHSILKLSTPSYY